MRMNHGVQLREMCCAYLMKYLAELNLSPSLTGSRIFFDNKLDFSGIKLAESYGLRYSNFKVPSK